jgi:hypothetical protein
MFESARGCRPTTHEYGVRLWRRKQHRRRRELRSRVKGFRFETWNLRLRPMNMNLTASVARMRNGEFIGPPIERNVWNAASETRHGNQASRTCAEWPSLSNAFQVVGRYGGGGTGGGAERR